VQVNLPEIFESFFGNWFPYKVVTQIVMMV